MKKNCYDNWPAFKKLWATKTFLSMRLTFYVLLLATIQSVALDGYAQVTKLNLSLNNTTVKQVLSEIEDVSEFYFLYNSKLIDVERKVDVNFKNKKIDEALDLLFKDTGVSYNIVDRQIVLSGMIPTKTNMLSVQQKNITGKVTDEAGLSLPGVTVLIKGTTNGTVTNMDGNYSIPNIPDDATLVFSFVGMKSQEIIVGKKSTINVTMAVDAIGIEEVVAVGYGTQKKKDLTGSISRVKNDEMILPSTSSFDQMLQGKVSGVQITQTSGSPGGNVNILVRGVNSITGGNQPLYVIDGFAITASDGSSNMMSYAGKIYSASSIASNTGVQINPLNSINPSDIESVEILKDASATAIYGSRGANGVVIITTKRGKIGKSQFNIDVSYGIQQVENKVDMMNSQEFIELNVEGRDNAWVVAGGNADDPNDVRSPAYRVPEAFRDPSSITTNTDWQDVIFHIAPVENYQLSANGGNEKLKYFISGGYFNQKGIVLTSDYKRFNIRSNMDIQLSEKLKVGSTISGSYGYGNYPNTVGHYGLGNVLGMALCSAPTIPVYDENGDPYFNIDDFNYNLGFLANPLTVLDKDNYSDNRNRANVMFNNYLEYRIIEGLIFKSTIGINYDAGTTKLWRSSAIPYYTTLNYPSSAGALKTNNMEWLNENTLSYKHTLNENHFIDALFGFTAQKASYERLSAGATDFPTNYITYISAGTVTSGTHVKSEWSMLSLISRINYTYKGKYLLTATLRRDGSSRFGANHKWGMFPSFSAGYNIAEEAFMNSISFINNLKIRASYGASGNNQISNYATIGLLGSSNYVENNDKLPGLVPSSLSNDDLTWEKSRQTDIGLDMGLFNDRISFTADVYKNKKTNLLLNVELPSASGYSSSVQNIGELENKGIELALQTINIKSNNFNWSSNLTFSTNKNKVLKLATEGARISNSSYQVTEVGHSIASFYMLHAIGVFQNEEEVSSSPLQSSSIQPGDLKFEDVNKDGKITSSDKKYVGSPFPDYIWGLNNKFIYKNFSLSIGINGSHGADTYIQNGVMTMNVKGSQNNLAIVNQRWRSESDPGNGRIPRACNSSYSLISSVTSYYLWDASYVRIKNINLSYSVPRDIISRFSLSNLTVYADIANAFTFTDYPMYNPEASSTGNSITQSGVDYFAYPLARTYTFGVKLSF